MSVPCRDIYDVYFLSPRTAQTLPVRTWRWGGSLPVCVPGGRRRWLSRALTCWRGRDQALWALLGPHGVPLPADVPRTWVVEDRHLSGGVSQVTCPQWEQEQVPGSSASGSQGCPEGRRHGTRCVCWLPRGAEGPSRPAALTMLLGCGPRAQACMAHDTRSGALGVLGIAPGSCPAAASPIPTRGQRLQGPSILRARESPPAEK